MEFQAVLGAFLIVAALNQKVLSSWHKPEVAGNLLLISADFRLLLEFPMSR